jgi:tetratricopeptide (TPR) repeat protein
MKCPRCMASLTIRKPDAGVEDGWSLDIGAAPAAPPAPPPPAGARYYLRRRTGKVFGPFLEKAIASMLEQRKLDGDEEISLDGSSWQPLDAVPGLAVFSRSSSGKPSAISASADGGVDLPAPKGALQEIVDLPGLRGNLDISDLPAPKGGGGSVAASRGFDLQGFDQPAPMSTGELDLGPADTPELPAPKRPSDLGELVDLPAPKEGIVGLPAPKVSAPRPPAPRLPPAPAAPPAPPRASTGLEYGQIDLGGMDELSDLPGPREISNLGTGMEEGSDLPGPREISDLPTPKGVMDLPTPRRAAGAGAIGVTDVLQPKRSLEDEGEPPELDDLPVSAGKSIGLASVEVELPVPKRSAGAAQPGEVTDLVEPKAGFGVPIVDVVAPKRSAEEEEEPEVVRFEPPPREAGAPIVEAYAEPEAEGRVEEATPKPRRRTLLWAGAGLGFFAIVVGLSLGLLTDYGFFGLNLITGTHTKATRAKGQISSGMIAFRLDTYQGYTRAAADFGQASNNLPDNPDPRALQVQALAALVQRFGGAPNGRPQLDAAAAKLPVDKDKRRAPQVQKALGLVALVNGQAPEALAQLRPASEKEPGDALAAVYLAWAHLTAKDPRAATAAFARALTSSPNLPAAVFGLARAHLLLKEQPAAEAVLDKALPVVTRHPGILLLKAQLLLDGGKVKPAQALLEQAIRLADQAAPAEVSQAQAALGEVAFKEGQNNEARTRFTAALKIDPNSLMAHIGIGRMLYSSRNYSDALAHFRRAQTLEPTDINAASMVVHTVIELGKPLEARKALQTIINVAPQAPEILFLQGLVDATVGNLGPAERFFKEAIKQNPTYFPPYLHLSRIYIKQNKESEAHAILSQADARVPVSPLVRNAQGEVYYAAKKMDKARAKFEEALGLDPSYNEALFNLANALCEQGKLDEAKAKYVQLEAKDKEYPNLAARIGVLYMRLKDYATAAAAFDRALAVELPTVETRLAGAKAYILAGKPEKAVKQCAIVLENNAAPEARALRAAALYEQRKYDEAFIEVQQAIEREKKPDYYVTLGRVQEARGKVADAIDAYAEVLALDATRVEIRARRGILLVKNGAVQDGQQELKKVVRENPDMAEAYMYIGDAQADQRQEAEALRSYLTAVGKDPKLAEAQYKIGQIHCDNQRKAQAIPYLETATKHGKVGERWLPDAYRLLGDTLLDRGQKKGAIDAFTKYVEIAPAGAAALTEVKRKLATLGVTLPPKK